MRRARSSAVVVASLAVLAVLLGAACDTGADGAASPAAADATGGGDGADAVEVAPPPPASAERALTSGDGDDLFPALDGDDLVWARLVVDPSAVPAGGEAPDCVSCPWCGGCSWKVMHKKLSSGSERVLHVGVGLQTAPSVGGGHAVFVDGNSATWDVDLASGASEPIQTTAWGGRAIRIRGGRAWWYGYDSLTGQAAITAWDLASDERVTAIPGYLSETWWSSGSQLSNIGRGAPFDVDGARVVYALWSGSSVVHASDVDGRWLGAVVVDPERDHIRPVLVGDAVVTESYDRATGCNQSVCTVAFTAFDADGVGTPLAPDAVPSMYVAPVASGTRLVWVDRREGGYALWGVDLAHGAAAAEPVRLSSADARIGTLAAPALGGDRLVWSDRRTGRWHLVMREWPH